jgi:hypothetical protein
MYYALDAWHALMSNDSAALLPPLAHYGSNFLLEAVQLFQQDEKASGSPRDELKQYLESSAEKMEDIIVWWGVCILTVPFSYILTVSVS